MIGYSPLYQDCRRHGGTSRSLAMGSDSRKAAIWKWFSGNLVPTNQRVRLWPIRRFSPQVMCGGTLLNSNTILTAAHCFDPIPGGGGINYVRLGDHDITTTNDGASPTDVSIVRYESLLWKYVKTFSLKSLFRDLGRLKFQTLIFIQLRKENISDCRLSFENF